MFEKGENTVQIKSTAESNISPKHKSYNLWYGLKYSFRVANFDTVKGTQEKTRAEKGQKVKKVNTVMQLVTIEF